MTTRIIVLCAILLSAALLSARKSLPLKFNLPDGYVAEVAAAPPLVTHPMMATVDDRGRLFVAEATGVNLKKADLEKQTPNRIRLLEDTNNDGIYDKTSIFADKMTFPQGACWLNGTLYVASPPGIWALTDSDDDGVADIRQQLVTGFEYTGNAADVHGPFLHPSGRLYWCHGRKGHEVYQARGGELVSKGKGARIWSMMPDGSDIRVHAGGGMDNPVEVDFTPEGEIIGSVNLFYGRPRGDTMVHWLLGGRYPRFDHGAVLEEFVKTGPILREAHNFGHVAVSGMMISDTSEGVETLTTFFNNQKIEKTHFRWEGSELKSVSSEVFLEFENPDVHLTDVLHDANGDLLVIDTGGWFRIGCPTSQTAKPEILGAIYRIRKAGVRNRQTDFVGKDIDWHNLSAKELGKLLDDDRWLVRRRALATLPICGDKQTVKVLSGLLRTGNQRTRRNAVWTLTRCQAPDARKAIRTALTDPSSSVVHAACNSIIATRDSGAVERLAQVLQANQHPNLRHAAAAALGATRSSQAIPILAKLMTQNIDRATEHAAINAVIEINDYDAIQHGAKLGKEFLNSKQAKLRICWAMDQMKSGRLEPEQLMSHFLTQTGDINFIGPAAETAVAIAKGHPEWGNYLGGFFQELLQSSPQVSEHQDQFRELAPVMLESLQMQVALAMALKQPGGFSEAALDAISKAQKKVTPPRSWIAALQALLNNAKGLRLEKALFAMANLDSKSFLPTLRKISDDESIPTRIRFLALRAQDQNPRLNDARFGLLLELLGEKALPADRAQAISLLATLQPTKPQFLRLTEVLQNSGPVDFGGLLNAFNKTRDADVGAQLAATVSSAPAAVSLPPREIRRVLNRFPLASIQVAQGRLAELENQRKVKQARLESLVGRVEKDGMTARGFQVYKTACIACHKVMKEGADIGPNLSRIGAIRQPRDLLESIFFPNKSLARDFEAYQITKRDGSVYLGMIKSDSAERLNIISPGGIELQIARIHVRSIRPASVSMMPMGLDAALSDQQLLDLVAWMDSLQ